MRQMLYRLAAVSALAIVPSFSATMVGVELQLLVDVSGSISAAEFALQKAGYASAFMDAGIIANIEAQTAKSGGVAVQYVEWAGKDQQKVVIDWALLTDGASSNAFAAAILAAPRSFKAGLTGVQGALAFGSPLFDSNDFDGLKQITDISGDGFCNDPSAGCGTSGKDSMTKAGVRVNGLVLGAVPSVLQYYTDNVVTNGGIVYNAAVIADFADVLRTKLRDETTASPEPATWGMIAAGLAGLVLASRRRRAA